MVMILVLLAIVTEYHRGRGGQVALEYFADVHSGSGIDHSTYTLIISCTFGYRYIVKICPFYRIFDWHAFCLYSNCQ